MTILSDPLSRREQSPTDKNKLLYIVHDVGEGSNINADCHLLSQKACSSDAQLHHDALMTAQR